LYLDEIALKKGHGSFETVVSTNTKVLTLIQGKTSEAIQAFLKELPGIQGVKYACMDMCASFAHALKAVIPRVKIVTDRFHLIRQLNEALDSIRKRLHRQLDEAKRKRFARIHFLLGRDYADLHRDERRLVQDYLRLNSPLKRIYPLTQAFREILFRDWSSREDAYVALRDWCDQARRHLSSFVKTVERWWQAVLNACLFPWSNGRQEGINQKIKLIKRQGYGFRNRQLFRLKVLAAFNP
jgi:transposase